MRIINRTKDGFIAGDNVTTAPTKKMELLKTEDWPVILSLF
ncbi:hypothetical protein P3T75_10400 [Enterococcus montenegrensis]|nr:hypothetical protein [Enterococcus montenegrensis]WHA08714.1 hypothetical protein P3T75_10400 [Enterococcus montenegrensis]